MSIFKDGLLQMAKYIEDVENSSFDLWTWLPSHKEAEKYHGDYADEFKPEPQYVIKEACAYLSSLKYDTESLYFKCPCENEHHPDIETEDVTDMLNDGMTIEQIAEEFGTEPHIIENIREFIYNSKF